MSYNLLDERWIPALYRNGRVKRVNIGEAFTDANQIREFAAANPMDRVALLRFFLALLYWCNEHIPDTLPDDAFSAGRFGKLQEHRDCFNLFGDSRRFYQWMEPDDKTHPSTYLIHEVPTGTNFWHFRHSSDESSGLCSACCVMGLLRLPVFSTQGGRTKSPGINAKPPIYVIPIGSSLAETLRLSWRRAPALGTPAWEKPDVQLPRAGDVPLLTGLTWLPRRVWLDDPCEPEARCIRCARRSRLVRHMVFKGLGSAKAEGRTWRDPHVVSEGGRIAGPADALDASDAAASNWTRSLAAILETVPGGRKLWVTSFATVQNDKYVEATEFVVPLPSPLDESGITESVARITAWRNKGLGMKRDLARILRPKRPLRPKAPMLAQTQMDAIRSDVEARVSAGAPELVRGREGGWQQAGSEYAPLMAAVARSLSPGYTSAALRGRRAIENLRPDMRPRARPAQKGRHKAGGAE